MNVVRIMRRPVPEGYFHLVDRLLDFVHGVTLIKPSFVQVVNLLATAAKILELAFSAPNNYLLSVD